MEQQKHNPSDRHRTGYYKEYNGGKDRHRPGYWAEYYKRKKAAKEQKEAAEREKRDKEMKSWLKAYFDSRDLEDAATMARQCRGCPHPHPLWMCA
jgi:hypothetical protein